MNTDQSRGCSNSLRLPKVARIYSNYAWPWSIASNNNVRRLGQCRPVINELRRLIDESPYVRNL